MARSIKRGDAISWNSHCGEAHGEVVKKLAKPTGVSSENLEEGADGVGPEGPGAPHA